MENPCPPATEWVKIPNECTVSLQNNSLELIRVGWSLSYMAGNGKIVALAKKRRLQNQVRVRKSITEKGCFLFFSFKLPLKKNKLFLESFPSMLLIEKVNWNMEARRNKLRTKELSLNDRRFCLYELADVATALSLCWWICSWKVTETAFASFPWWAIDSEKVLWETDSWWALAPKAVLPPLLALPGHRTLNGQGWGWGQAAQKAAIRRDGMCSRSSHWRHSYI